MQYSSFSIKAKSLEQQMSCLNQKSCLNQTSFILFLQFGRVKQKKRKKTCINHTCLNCHLFQPKLWADRSFWHYLFNIKDSHCVTSKGSIDFWVRVQPLYVLLWKSLLFTIANDMPAGLNLPTFIAIIQSIIFISELMWFKQDAFA